VSFCVIKSGAFAIINLIEPTKNSGPVLRPIYCTTGLRTKKLVTIAFSRPFVMMADFLTLDGENGVFARAGLVKRTKTLLPDVIYMCKSISAIV